MIQGYLRDLCAEAIPSLRWSEDYRALDDHTGTVYGEAGNPPSRSGDIDVRYPAYMVLIRTSKWDAAKQYTHKVRNLLHKRSNFTAREKQYDETGNVVGEKAYHVFSLVAASEPIRLGPDANNVMEYTINFDVTLKELKEET